MTNVIRHFGARLLRRVSLNRSRRTNAPATGYTTNLNQIKFVDDLSDRDLAELNALLDWKSFVADGHGRRFGGVAWSGKRNEPQSIPDPRILLLHEQLDLADKHVLEIGCFEGNHTVGLGRFARRVTAVDGRIGNVVKTIVRCAMFDQHPTVFKCDVEARPLDVASLQADVVHHVGVLYHLKDPVSHLRDLGTLARVGVMLDTHYALDAEATETYEIGGREYRYKRYLEFGPGDPFSGMHEHSKWLRLDEILSLLAESGLADVRVLQTRNERNGPRVLIVARRAA
ncbi:MAG: class I SAM-dependent methyltransferase [Gemmatimonadaceae bacterium]